MPIFRHQRHDRPRTASTGPAAFLLAALALAALAAPVQAGADSILLAARPEAPATTSVKTPGITPTISNPLVMRVQKALGEAKIYHGPLNGRLNFETESAIREYQKSAGLPADGRVTEKLAERLETGTRVGLLLNRLERIRASNIEVARLALMSNPKTRNLLGGDEVEIADPTRDASPCFRDPTAQCLLAEAAESAKAIFRPEMRDWALGEILVAQAQAGFAKEAMDTVRRINDPRLIMVALRDIAKAQALAGRNREALAAAEIIPDPLKQVEALAMIADIQAQNGDDAEVRNTIRRLLWSLRHERDTLKQVSIRAQVAVIMALAGDETAAKANMDVAESLARAQTRTGDKGVAMQHIASALAEMEKPDRALAVLDEFSQDSDRTPVLVTAATAQARAGNAAQALVTAEGIETLRYRAVVLSRIATAQTRAGNVKEAEKTLEKALAASAKVKFPYAHDYAVSRIVESQVEIGKRAADGNFVKALETTRLIEDDRLRAHVLWKIAAEQRRRGDTAGAARTETRAKAATKAMKSSLSRVWMFSEIALGHFAADEKDTAWAAFRRAVAVAENIQNAWGRARALGKLAATLTELTEPVVR